MRGSLLFHYEAVQLSFLFTDIYRTKIGTFLGGLFPGAASKVTRKLQCENFKFQGLLLICNITTTDDEEMKNMMKQKFVLFVFAKIIIPTFICDMRSVRRNNYCANWVPRVNNRAGWALIFAIFVAQERVNFVNNAWLFLKMFLIRYCSASIECRDKKPFKMIKIDIGEFMPGRMKYVRYSGTASNECTCASEGVGHFLWTYLSSLPYLGVEDELFVWRCNS